MQISLDLNTLEPGRWDGTVVSRAQALARLHAQRNEPQLAVMHARAAMVVRKAAADRHSATSAERLEYAARLADYSSYMRNLAETFDRRTERGNRDSDEHVGTAIKARQEANAIRESVLRADPTNSECRCNIGSNLQWLGDTYRRWGKPAEQLQALEAATQLYREMNAAEPNDDRWIYNLGHSLYLRSGAHWDQTPQNSAQSVRDLLEAAPLLDRASQSKQLSNDLKRDSRSELYDSYFELSYRGLFLIRRDATFAGRALAAADAAIAMAPEVKKDAMFPLTNKAHALMYLGRDDETLAIHAANRGKKVGDFDLGDRDRRRLRCADQSRAGAPVDGQGAPVSQDRVMRRLGRGLGYAPSRCIGRKPARSAIFSAKA